VLGGFNASHSMGLILFGLVFGFLALAHDQLLFQSPFLLVVGLAMLGGFGVLCKVYFFSAPLTGIGISFACYVAALCYRRVAEPFKGFDLISQTGITDAPSLRSLQGGSRAAWNNNLKPPSPKEIHSPLAPHQERVGHPPDADYRTLVAEIPVEKKARLAVDTAAAVGRHVLRTGCRLLAAAVIRSPLRKSRAFFVRHTTVNTALLSTGTLSHTFFAVSSARNQECRILVALFW